MKAKKKEPIRIDFDIHSRKIIEVYEISPDGSRVKTKDGWVSAYREGIIIQRPPHELGFTTSKQVQEAIFSERELLKDKRYKDSAAYLVAKKHPIKEWLKG